MRAAAYAPLPRISPVGRTTTAPAGTGGPWEGTPAVRYSRPLCVRRATAEAALISAAQQYAEGRQVCREGTATPCWLQQVHTAGAELLRRTSRVRGLQRHAKSTKAAPCHKHSRPPSPWPTCASQCAAGPATPPWLPAGPARALPRAPLLLGPPLRRSAAAAAGTTALNKPQRRAHPGLQPLLRVGALAAAGSAALEESGCRSGSLRCCRCSTAADRAAAAAEQQQR